MEDGPPRFRQGSTCPVVLRCHPRPIPVSSTGLSPALAGLPRPFDYRHVVRRGHCRFPWMVLQPDSCNAGRLAQESFGLVRVRSPLLAESRLISFPEGTEMFQFPSFATLDLCIQSRLRGLHPRRFPDSETHGSTPAYGSPWLIAVLPRPSSPLGAKASTECPY